MTRHLLIDGDVLVYQSSFGAQKTRYTVKSEGDTRTFENAKDRDAWLKEQGYTKDDVIIESFLDVLSEDVALLIARRNLDDILTECKCNSYTLFITGSTNFRNDVAVTKPYKGNRKDVEKPVHYKAVKDYYLTNPQCVVSDGCEADDLLSQYQCDNTIICTIDKDLNQVEGKHYDWNLDIKYKVSTYDAHRYFMAQLLAGDSTDNIPGIARYGMTTAFKALDVKEDLLSKWHAVKLIYKDKGHDEAYLTEQGKLLWMQRPHLMDWTPDAYEELLESLT